MVVWQVKLANSESKADILRAETNLSRLETKVDTNLQQALNAIHFRNYGPFRTMAEQVKRCGGAC